MSDKMSIYRTIMHSFSVVMSFALFYKINTELGNINYNITTGNSKYY